MTTTQIVSNKPPAAVIVAAPYAPAGPIVICTSNSNVTIAGPANYSFVVNETGLGFQSGMRVRASAQADPNSWIEGVVVSFDQVTLVIAADLSNGFGAFVAWNISITGQPGKTGATGNTGAQGPQGPPGGLVNPNVALTGTPTCPVAGPTDSSMQIANTQWIRNLLVANYQPLDGDLTSLAAASTIAIYYRKGTNDWEPVVIDQNMAFDPATGKLSATLTGTAPIASPAFTGDPTRVTPPTAGDNDLSLANTGWVQGELAAYAKLASPVLTGTPTAPTPGATDSSSQITTTGWVQARLANMQPLDPDLTSIGNISASGIMVWRRGSGDWAPVIIGANLAFDAGSGTLNASGGSGGGGGIPEAPTGTGLAYARKDLGWVQAITPVDLVAYAQLASPAFSGTPRAPTAAPGTNTDQLATTGFVTASFAPLASPALTGAPTAPTPVPTDNTTKIATTAYVQNVVVNYAPLASPALTGAPTAPTPTAGDSSGRIATTSFVATSFAPKASPIFTGDPQAPTPPTADNDTSIATTAFVKNQAYAPLASPALTGTPTAPTPAAGDSTTKVATTAFVENDAGRSRVLVGTYNPAGVNGVAIPLPPGYEWFEIEACIFRADNANAFLLARLSTDNGASYYSGSSDYHWAGWYSGSQGATSGNQGFFGGVSSYLQVSTGALFAVSNPVQLSMKLHRPTFTGTGMFRALQWTESHYGGGNEWFSTSASGGLMANGLPLTHIVFLFNDGGLFANSPASLVKIWGLK